MSENRERDEHGRFVSEDENEVENPQGTATATEDDTSNPYSEVEDHELEAIYAAAAGNLSFWQSTGNTFETRASEERLADVQKERDRRAGNE